MLNVDEHKQLLEKRKAIQETLVDTQVKPQRKAVVPTRAIVWALEQGAEGTPPENRVPELTKAVDRYIMAMARFNLACSARFNDVQHTSPQTVKSTSNTLELLAWQTKTTSAVAIKRNPVLGGQMVDPLGAVVEEIQGLGGVPRDGLPAPRSTRTGRASSPAQTPDRSLRWLKDALGKQGAPVRSWRSRTSMLSRRCTWDAPDVSGIAPSQARGWPWSPTQHRTPRPPSPSPRTPTRAWTLSRTRRRSSSRKLSEGWIAQVLRALTRFPPYLKARRQEERAQCRLFQHPPEARGCQGAKGPDTQPRRGETQVPRAQMFSCREPGDTEVPRALRCPRASQAVD